MHNLLALLKRPGLGAVSGALLALLACGSAADAANPLELNFWLSGPRYDGRVAECEKALGTITSQFGEKESMYWNSELRITGYGGVHENAVMAGQSGKISRPVCSAALLLYEGEKPTGHPSTPGDGRLAG